MRGSSLATRTMAAALALAATPAHAAGEPRHEVTRIFLDNDFLGPGQSNIQSLIPLLRDERAVVIGIGVVTGDAWVKEETQHLLRFLEIIGRPDVPVYPGAEMPLIRTQAEMRDWEAHWGKVPFKGAWSSPRPGRTYHPDDPSLVPALPEGAPAIKPSGENAVTALIRSVRAHPGEVTIVAAGPLTDIALAIRIAPDLPSLAKEIVLEGGKLDTDMARVTGNADYATDFNFLFDPEAAHIVLTAPWKRVTVLGNVSSSAKATPELIDRIGAAGTPVARYVKSYARLGQPLWDEITVAVAIDPSLVTDEVVAKMDVDTLPGGDYGRALVWKDEVAPGRGERPVHIVRAVDTARFLARFEAQAKR
ncbi:nucleoside hydrolase [uncultured Sphingomonas sp.]|uniref:nucleoside hydrolase n=1 Tax=uncultured Sphingomonas sp. TaxID=158754 RepID=UPI0035CB1BE8